MARAQQRKADVERQLEATRAQLEATNERLTARSGRNLVSATLIGVIGVGAMGVSLLLIKELFMVLAGALVILAALELSNALRHAGRDIPRIPTGIAAVIAVPAAYYGGISAAWLAVLGGSAFVALWRLGEQLLRRTSSTRRDLLLDMGLGVFVQAYVTFLGAFAVRLVAEEGGQFWTLSFLVLVILVDIGAYASGLTWGKHPMRRGSARRRPGRLRGRRSRRDRRGRPARRPPPRSAVVGRRRVRSGHAAERDARRPRRVAHQARHRHQGHELLAPGPRRRARPAGLDPPVCRRGLRALLPLRALTGPAALGDAPLPALGPAVGRMSG
ncbi:phosphatidate cytidylyltransferase [Rathayibacter sp. VKM Ac-2630]|uniref:phosphatidate cytidylyltransferase n=1 Tax=Rathayibacter sp. VKM Ac-2630 TaxID=1938617 RepID=UPI001F1D7131